jgi:hypothetical protein
MIPEEAAIPCLNNNRCSAREVKIRYGSLVPFVTKSSIKTRYMPRVVFALTIFLIN